jgi:sugar phosphate isomerase/epimerase
MRLGIFAKTFEGRTTAEELAGAIACWGFRAVQLNLSCLGWNTLPDHLDERRCSEVASCFRAQGLEIAAVSGTFNMVHPSGSAEANLRRLETLASACRWLDTRMITLCTGTRDPDDLWRWHPENVRRSTWRELVAVMKRVAAIADRSEVTMAFEPEIGNVVNSAVKARLLLDEVASPWIKVVIDPANLLRPEELSRTAEILEEAFEWLGSDVALAHAKELTHDGRFGELAPGEGAVDWDGYLGGLARIGYAGPLIMHGLPESRVAAGVEFLRSKLGLAGRNN